MVLREGLVAPWEGRFGVLGSRGGFLASEIVAATRIGAVGKDGEEGTEAEARALPVAARRV